MKDWYIWLDGEKVQVTEELYHAYKRFDWRWIKQQEVSQERECSYDFMCEYDMDEPTVRGQALVEDIVADKLLLEELYAALDELTSDERNLINALFFEEKTGVSYLQKQAYRKAR